MLIGLSGSHADQKSVGFFFSSGKTHLAICSLVSPKSLLVLQPPRSQIGLYCLLEGRQDNHPKTASLASDPETASLAPHGVNFIGYLEPRLQDAFYKTLSQPC